MRSRPRSLSGSVALAAVLAAMSWSNPVDASIRPDGVRNPQVLTPAGPEPAQFGQAVDMDGDLMVVGDNRDRTNGRGAGAVYVYARSDHGWIREAKVVPAELQATDYFGFSVAVSGETIVVGGLASGAPDPAPSLGVAYVLERVAGRWTATHRLDAPEPRGDSQFGYSVDIDGDTIVVGAPETGDGGAADNAGAAYVFVRGGGGWPMQATLALPPVQDDHFGRSVAVDGNTLLVGAPGVDAVDATGAGAGYVFTRSGTTWRPSARLSPPAPRPGRLLGSSVALDGDTAVLGQDSSAVGSKSVYVFVGSARQWVMQAALLSDEEHLFGFRVAVDGDTLAVTDPLDSSREGLSGAVHVYARDGETWTKRAKLTSPTPTLLADYGWSVAVDSGSLAVGELEGKGTVYIYSR